MIERHPEQQKPSASNSARRTRDLLQWILQISSYREQWWEVSPIRGTKWVRYPDGWKVWGLSVYVESKSYDHLDDHHCTSVISPWLGLLLWSFSLFLIIFFSVFISYYFCMPSFQQFVSYLSWIHSYIKLISKYLGYHLRFSSVLVTIFSKQKHLKNVDFRKTNWFFCLLI